MSINGEGLLKYLGLLENKINMLLCYFNILINAFTLQYHCRFFYCHIRRKKDIHDSNLIFLFVFLSVFISR